MLNFYKLLCSVLGLYCWWAHVQYKLSESRELFPVEVCSQTSEASRASQACSSSFSNVPYLLHSTLDSPLPHPFPVKNTVRHLRLILYFICVTVLPVSMYVHEVRCLWDSTLVAGTALGLSARAPLLLTTALFSRPECTIRILRVWNSSRDTPSNSFRSQVCAWPFLLSTSHIKDFTIVCSLSPSDLSGSVNLHSSIITLGQNFPSSVLETALFSQVFSPSNIKCLPHKKEVELTHTSPWFMSSIFHAVFFLQIQNLFYPWFMGSFRVRPHNITQNGYELAVKLNSPASASWVDDVGESRHQLVNE